jgi:hypothetical protein
MLNVGSHAAVTVKLTPLLGVPPTVTTTLPVAAPVGTITTMLVALQFVGVAAVPLNVTVFDPWVAPKFTPVIVTEVPTGPDVGLRLLMLGMAIPVPLSEIASGTISMLSGTLTAPARLPAAAGVKVTLIVHMPPTAIGDDDAQLSVSEKSPIALTGPTFKP